MPSTPTYDPRCYDLAALFLEDVPHLDTNARVLELAALIQSTIEDYIALEEDNYEPPTGAPQDDPDFAGFADNH